MTNEVCQFCRNKMPKENLPKHMRHKHKDELEMVKCEYCPNNMHRSSLEQHIRTQHPKIFEELESKFAEGFECGKAHAMSLYYEYCTVGEWPLLRTDLFEHLVRVHTADIIVPTKPVFRRRSQCPVIRNVESLYRKPRTADVFFVFKNYTETETRIPAHKCILASHSLIFRRTFYGQLKEVGDITIVDASPAGFLVFLQSFYTSNVNVTEEIASEVLYLANKYDAVRCRTICQDFLTTVLCTTNVLVTLKLATMYDCALLRQSCINVIIRDGPSIIQTEEFYNCDRYVLRELLSTHFQDRNEFLLFNACVKWAKHACEQQGLDPSVAQDIRMALGDCFDLIKFQFMNAVQFIECQRIYGDMFSSVELNEKAKALAANVAKNLVMATSTSHTQEIRCTTRTEIDSTVGTIENLFGDEETADVFFVFKTSCDQSERIPAHQCILAHDSNVFDRLLFDDVIENRSLDVIGTDVDAFSIFLQSFYGKKMQLTMENVAQIMHFANEYEAQVCLYACDEFLDSKLCVDNVLWIFELCHRFRRAELYESCKKIIEKNNSLLTSASLLNCSCEILKQVLMVDFLARNEFIIFQTCIKWAKHACEIANIAASTENIRETLGDIFGLIRFTSMSTTEFIECLIDYGAMFNEDTLKRILTEES